MFEYPLNVISIKNSIIIECISLEYRTAKKNKFHLAKSKNDENSKSYFTIFIGKLSLFIKIFKK